MVVTDEYQTYKIFRFMKAFANCRYKNIPRWSVTEAA